jgi:hypothetical protein
MSVFSTLHVYPCVGDDAPEQFAWTTSLGCLYGRLDTRQIDAFRITTDDTLYRCVPRFYNTNFPSYPKSPSGRLEVPIASALTEFHVLLVYEQRLTAVSVLNQSINYEDIFGQVDLVIMLTHCTIHSASGVSRR